MKNNKKQKKLSIFLGVGFGIIAAGTTATLLATIAKTKKEDPYTYAITFDKGTGTSIEGNTKINFKNETSLDLHETPVVHKIVMKEGFEVEYNFVDWVDEQGSTIYPQTVINKTTKLTATYADELPEGSYYNVSFIVKNPGDYLTGITKLSVPKGRTLGSINKPQPHSSNSANVFKGWALATDSNNALVDPDTPITADMVLTPIYSTSVQFVWHGNGGTYVTGDETIKTENNVKFSSLNQPVYTHPDATKFIAGWYKEDPTGKTEEELQTLEKWKASDLIPAEATVNAWAVWTSQDVTKQTKLNFVQNKSDTQPTVKFEGNTVQLADKSAEWSTINRPNPYAPGYTPIKWEYSTSASGGQWIELLDTFKFGSLENVSEVWIRPVMQQNLDSIVIYGPTVLKQTESGQYSAFLSPSDIKTNVTWEVYKATGDKGKITDGSVSIDSSGVLTTTLSSPAKVIIRATPEVNPQKYATLEVSILDPTVQSADYFTFDDKSKKWLKLNGLFDDGNISFETLDGSTTPLTPEARDKFNRDVYIGQEVRMVNTGFLTNCTAFNSQVKFTSKNTKVIGDSFMAGCSSFNQKLDVSNIQHFGNYFLAYATKFNNGSTANAANSLILTSALTIGNYFLSGKFNKDTNLFESAFNSPITLGESVKKIGEGFLWNACEFNQTVNFPASLTSIDDFCMYGCDNYQSSITVDTAASNFSDNYQNFCSAKKSAAIYQKGFKVLGTKYADFLTKFPEIEQDGGKGVGSCYRLPFDKNGNDVSTCGWQYLVTRIEKYEQGKMTLTEFLNSFTKKDSNGLKSVPTKLEDFLGVERYIKWNNVSHKVRIVAVNFDTYKSGSETKKALFTFEFINVLSNTDGYGLTLPANKSKDNQHYTTSTLYQAMNKGGSSFVGWIAFKNKTPLANSKPAIDMFNEANINMKEHIKTVTRWVEEKDNGAWKEKEYQAQLYVPLAKNVANFIDSDTNLAADHKKTYDFYKNFKEYSANSIQYQRKQVKDDEEIDYTRWDVDDYGDCKSAYMKNLYNGWVAKSGVWNWYSSPVTTMDGRYWQNRCPDEKIKDDYACSALAVAPAFAI